jgi:hypothetical protein
VPATVSNPRRQIVHDFRLADVVPLLRIRPYRLDLNTAFTFTKSIFVHKILICPTT